MSKLLLPFILGLLFLSCTHELLEYHPEYRDYFEEYEVEGSFLLYDFQADKTIIYNEEKGNTGLLPASTFKMVNTLTGLETNTIKDITFVIPWDSVHRQVPAWNKDHNLASAFQSSVVPWYQELARRIGHDQMQNWVTKAEFGSMVITEENLDLFWLSGKSRITAFEQLDFQKRLVKNQLPFQQKHIDLLKEIMVMEEINGTILRGKTGWAVMDGKDVGWLVGYIENSSGTYAYVINVVSDNEDSTLFRKSRKEIVVKILKELTLI